jgi:hypothetical protein
LRQKEIDGALPKPQMTANHDVVELAASSVATHTARGDVELIRYLSPAEKVFIRLRLQHCLITFCHVDLVRRA